MTSRWPETAAGVLVAAALGAALLSPADVNQGDLARIMYVHVPSAWLAYLAFAVTAVGSALYLVRRRPRWDHLAAASAEIGVLFTGLALLTGMVWGKPVWGVYWTWDARLTLTAFMFFVYLGYLALRRGIADPDARASRSAILGIVAVAQIPIVHFSVTWWRGLHQPPTVLRPDDVQIDPPLFWTLMLGVTAFTAVYAVLLRHRTGLERRSRELYEAQADARSPVAGDAVLAPEVGSGE